MNVLLRAIFPLALLLPSCTNITVKVEPLRYYDACMASAAEGAVTHVCGASQLPADIPSLVPYAFINGSGSTKREKIEQRVCRKIPEIGYPDLLVFEDRGQVVTGQTSVYPVVA